MVPRLSAVLLVLSLPCLAVGQESPSAQEKTPSWRAAVITDSKLGPAARHGVQQLKAALRAKGVAVVETVDASAKHDVVVYAGLGIGPEQPAKMLKANNIAPPEGPESLVIQKSTDKDGQRLLITGGDDRGLMYALLDVADRLGWAQANDPLAFVQIVREKADVAERGMSCHAMQQAYFENRLFNEDYWDRYFSALARNRFNAYVMIFGYENAGYLAPPYPYFCDVDGFPDVRVVGWSKEKQQRYLDALNRVIRQAHEHGIRFSVGIWDHIYRGGVQTGGAKEAKAGRPGTVVGVTEKNLVAYSRAAFAMFMKKLPDLDGVQFRMHDESGLKAGAEMRQFWTSLFDDLNKTGRKLRFELRAKAMPDNIIDAAVSSGIDFRLSTRYWTEQMGLPFHPTLINRQNQFDRRHSYADLLRYPQRYPMLWQLWTGGTTRILLWGEPEYARRFAQTTHLYDGEGFTVYEPLTTKMASHPHSQEPVEILTAPYRYYDYEFERYWHFFQTFGRIGYNPKTPPEVWKKEFERRFGKETAPHIEAALHRASQILPRINAAIFPYNHFPTTYGWAEKQRKGDLPAYAKADVSDVQLFLTMDEAAKLMLEGGESAKVWPQQTSEWFSYAAQAVLENVAQAEAKSGDRKSKELISTLTDLRILAYLAYYHASRIHAGISYSLFKRSKDLHELGYAIAFEQDAIGFWSKLVDAAGDVYAPDLMMGRADAGLSGHWKDELAALQRGLAALQQEQKTARPAAGIAHVPVQMVQLGGRLSVRATIGGIGPKAEARVVYRAGKEEWTFQKLEPSSEFLYQTVLRPPNIGESLQYYLEVTDGGKTLSFPSAGKAKPLFFKEKSQFTPPDVNHTRATVAIPGKPLTIKAHATDPSGVKWMRVLYRNVNQKENYNIVPMKPAGKDEYEAVIPGEAIAAQWDLMYLIEAMDNDGNGTIYPNFEKEPPYVMVRVQR